LHSIKQNLIFYLIFQQNNLSSKEITTTFNLITSLKMKVEYNNLYTHFVFTTLNRMPLILEKHRDRIEKYITGIVNNNGCKLYSIYANPEHVHFLVSRSPLLDEETLATIVANSSEKFISDNRLCVGIFQWQQSCSAFSVSKRNIHELSVSVGQCNAIGQRTKKQKRKLTF